MHRVASHDVQDRLSVNMNSPSTPAVPPVELSRRNGAKSGKLHESVIGYALFGCAIISVVTTLAIMFVLVNDSVFNVTGEEAFFQQVSLTQFFGDTKWTPDAPEPRFGIWPLINGTFLVSLIACCTGVPLGLGAAIYLSEYAGPRERAFLKPILELLAGVPTVVYGYFGLIFITPYVLKPIFQTVLGVDVNIYNCASGGFVVGIMIIPMVASLSEDVLRSVPRGLRDAAYALGGTELDVSVRVVVPAAFSGILASMLLALARAIGETMAVTIACGNFRRIGINPFQSMQTMTGYIVDASFGEDDAGGLVFKSVFAVALTLFVITLTINIISQAILRRYREVYE